jgi:glutamine cyclotransferase
MIRNACMVVLAGIWMLGIAGCQTAPAAKAPAPAPAAAQPAPEVKQEPKQEPKGLVTQEEAGIKLRIDMPELKWFLDNARKGPLIPALKQEAVPQGIAYLEEKNWLLVTHYRENGKSSLLTVIDAETGKLVKAHELYKEPNVPYTGHAGGITASKQHLWISSDGKAYRLKKETLIQAQDGAKVVFEGALATDTRASFTIYGDGVLWVGEFAQGASYPTSKTHYMTNRDDKEHKAWAAGYKLDPQSDDVPAAKTAASGPAVPDYIISLPDMVQGMEVSKERVVLSQSYGRNAASLLIVHKLPLAEAPHATAKIGESEVPVWFLDSKNKQQELTVPPMSEGLVAVKDRLHILFESAAKPYMTSGTYPLDYIYSISLP